MASSYNYGISSSLRNLGDDLGSLASEIGALYTDNTDAAGREVKERAERLRDDFQDLMSETSAKGREVVEWARLDGVADTIEETVQARPWTMMAVATGLGFLASQAGRAALQGASAQASEQWSGKTASDMYRRTRDNLGEAISRTSEKGGELMQQAAGDGMTHAVGNAFRDRPWTLLAVATGLGVIASQVWGASQEGTQSSWTKGH